MGMFKKLKHSAQAGFEEKNDLLVNVSPGEEDAGIVVNLSSSIMKHYGEHIKNFIVDVIKQEGFQDVVLDIKDKGAWDYTIKARVVAALERGMKDA